MALRLFSPGIQMLVMLVSVGLAAESLVSEHKRDTWSGLIVTPLSGKEILRGKMLGVLWQIRKYLILLLGLWSVGLVSGALHPVGFVVALLGLAVSCWFTISLGLYVGLHMKDQVRQFWILPYFFLFLSQFLIVFEFPWGKSVVMGFGSMPFLTFLSLFSFEDLRMGWTTGDFLPFATYGIKTGGGFFAVALTCLLGVIFQAIAALYFHRASLRSFDKLAGRPVRSQTVENLGTTPLWISGTA